MAVVQNPVTGRTRKAYGPAVFSTQFGKNTMRTKPLDVKNPNTINQKQQRARFSLMVGLSRTLMSLIRITFKEVAKEMSQYNSFMQSNLPNAVSGNYPDFTIDYNRLVVAKGTLLGVQNGAVSPENGFIVDMTWNDNSDDINGTSTDYAVGLVINESKNEIVQDLTSKARADQNLRITVPSTWANDTVHVFLAFKAINSDATSNSKYLGVISQSSKSTFESSE